MPVDLGGAEVGPYLVVQAERVLYVVVSWPATRDNMDRYRIRKAWRNFMMEKLVSRVRIR